MVTSAYQKSSNDTQNLESCTCELLVTGWFSSSAVNKGRKD